MEDKTDAPQCWNSEPSEKRRRVETCIEKEQDDAAIFTRQESTGFDSGLSQCQTEDVSALDQEKHPHATVMESSDLDQWVWPMIAQLCEEAENSNDPRAESLIRNSLASMQLELSQLLQRKVEGQQEASTGEFVSSHVPFDHGKEVKGIRGDSKPRRGRSNAKGGVRAPVKFDMGSVISSDFVMPSSSFEVQFKIESGETIL
jgi:hypothetical protein